MLKKSSAIVLLIITATFTSLYSQDIRIGDWRSHLNYSDGLKVAETGDSVYCATKTGLFLFDRPNGATIGLSKSDGFSDVSTKAIRYYPKYRTLFIAYQNTNMDILKDNKIINVPDILRKGDIIGIKEINEFSFSKQFCYISTSFGIIKYNIEKNEIAEDYREIGPNGTQVPVNDVAFYQDSIYAATPIGILSASLSAAANLRDYRHWKLIREVNCITLDTFANKLWASFKPSGNPELLTYNTKSWAPAIVQNVKPIISLENNYGNLVIGSDDAVTIVNAAGAQRFVSTGGQRHAILGKDNRIWTAHYLYGMVRIDESQQFSFIIPNGPYTIENNSIYNYKDEMWVASGGAAQNWAPLFTNNGFYLFKENSWKNYNEFSVPGLGGFQSVISIVADPVTGHKWVSSFGNGLLEFNNEKIVKIYNGLNTPQLTNPGFDTSRAYIKLTGLTFDKDNNLWMSNFAVSTPLVVKKPDGKFHAFEIEGGSNEKDLTYLVADDYNQIWAATPGSGVIIYNHNGTIDDESDDKVKRFISGSGSGNLPSADILSIARDKAGQIWIGTSNGLAVVYDPSLVFTKYNSDAQQIWINDGKQSGYLLSGEAVTSIAIDGGNRKWLGTRRGVWVTDSTGTKILWNFTTRNSPLISDNIRAIGINGETGEVFIGTDKGIVSYRANATEPDDNFTDVYAFPNPVRPEYEGVIAIKGLARSSSVKITDITGNLVYETKSEGGTATWNGRNFAGERASSGVYLVFCANSDGSSSVVTKILFVR